MIVFESATCGVFMGDCLDVLRTMPDHFVESIVTDPPYGLSFMGKKWDYDVPNVAIWAECLRVLKPGGHLLAFSGSRTYHRMVVNIEDAGFEVRDQIMWVYGSGFPKSMDVSKAIDKEAGAEREVIQEYDNTFGINKSRIEQGYRPNEVKPGAITAPSTDAAKQWNGWGTALKPAHEPIVLARKPLIGTVAENVLTHGTGAINVDGCRVALDDAARAKQGIAKQRTNKPSGRGLHHNPDDDVARVVLTSEIETYKAGGRFPANLIHDGSDEVLALFPESKGQQGDVKGDEPSHTGDENSSCYGVYGRVPQPKRNDSGSASRFFYCAKAAKKERRGSKHPTVKPIALMRYLVRLITPPDGTVLDPFAGTGTTGEASHLEGFNSLLIEQSEDFVRDIIVRMNAVTDTPNTGAAA